MFQQWKLVCSYSTLSWVTTSIMFLGWLFGNIVFGILSDRFGRRKVLFGSSLMVCCFAFVSSFVPYYWLYAVCRFLIGFGLGKLDRVELCTKVLQKGTESSGPAINTLSA